MKSTFDQVLIISVYLFCKFNSFRDFHIAVPVPVIKIPISVHALYLYMHYNISGKYWLVSVETGHRGLIG